MRSYLYLTILILCSTTAFALSIAEPSSILEPANLTSTAPNNFARPRGDWECRSGGSVFLQRPKLKDCGLAVLKLPKTDSTGAFHNRGAADDFKLPLVETEGSCSVRIAIVEGWNRQETASWEEVATQAIALWYGCKAAVVDSFFIGASTTAGKQGKISITLQYDSGDFSGA